MKMIIMHIGNAIKLLRISIFVFLSKKCYKLVLTVKEELLSFYGLFFLDNLSVSIDSIVFQTAFELYYNVSISGSSIRICSSCSACPWLWSVVKHQVIYRI